MADSPSSGDTSTAAPADETSSGGAEYRVLARKYRPSNFDELIGQDVLVRTLTNAIRLNRVHHAFILTGVRGIGKTTTARIIARALNCIGPDGQGGPTITPCGVCARCVAIAEDRDVDVLEMDAASNTGVDDVREIIDGVRYTPVAARYKIYIIDEVHMLSRQAFNALLKTLEEPPEHVKFIFATTEIRKVPVTILSRCQRFDLRRLDEGELSAHLADIARREDAAVGHEAIAVLARAADGSVRDGLSLLDQVIAQSDPAAGEVSADQVRALLGMADRSQSLELFGMMVAGDASAALAQAGQMYRDGAGPLAVVQDLLDITHWMTRLKLTPDAEASGAGVSQTDAARAGEMAGKMAMGSLTRLWQILLKGIGEIQQAPQPMTALEMLIVRLCYVSELPTPGEIAARLEGEGETASTGASSQAPSAAASSEPAAGIPPADAAPSMPVVPPSAPAAPTAGGAEPALALIEDEPAGLPEVQPESAAAVLSEPVESNGPAEPPQDFRALVDLFRDRKEMVLYGQLYNDVHLVSFDIGRLEIRPGAEARRDLSAKVAAFLKDWTQLRWIITVSSEPGEPTLREQDEAAARQMMDDAAQDPLVRAVLDTFEGSELVKILDPAPGAGGDKT